MKLDDVVGARPAGRGMGTAPFSQHDRLGARPVGAAAEGRRELRLLLTQRVRDLLRSAQPVFVATATVVGHAWVFTHAPASPAQASAIPYVTVPKTRLCDGA